MANIVESFASALAKVVAKLFSSPIDFLSGKSCSSLCGPTWDFMCYVENFCIANLLRLTLVFLLLYIVVLFFYLSYKLGICTCFSCWFHLWEYCFTRLIKRRRKFYTTSEQDYRDESISYYGVGPKDVSRSFSYGRRRDSKESHLRNRNHDARLKINADLSYKYRKRRNHKFVNKRGIKLRRVAQRHNKF